MQDTTVILNLQDSHTNSTILNLIWINHVSALPTSTSAELKLSTIPHIIHIVFVPETNS